jgi:aryl-alcohol dehydrogenase-like predicted oxidoreductase
VRGGINVLDSAINYRFQRSERSIRAALAALAAEGRSRDELLLCTKGGYLTPDGEIPADVRGYFMREYIEPGILRVEEIAAGSHSMAPRYLENQLVRSLTNLGVECIDVYYLHNPETQLGEVPREEFARRLRAAFEVLESAVAAGRIRFYGLATWNGFRQPPGAPDLLSLPETVALAREVAGEDHHCRFVQLPFNLAMAEALGRPNQKLNGRELTVVEAADLLGVTLVGSASLLQGRLAGGLPDFLERTLGLASDSQRALQFARSSPGITTSLVGMRGGGHVTANLELLAVPPAEPEKIAQLFAQAG